ncbi:hypothetical protein PV326_010456 [Microctonus aethiopoides]|nr:hypothetical protein PV326_010456 [Microctonus aethiopoides]
MANLAWWLPGGRNWEIERTGKSFYCIPFPCSGKGNYARSGLPIAVGFNHEASEPYNIPPPSLCVLTLYTFWRIGDRRMRRRGTRRRRRRRRRVQPPVPSSLKFFIVKLT